MSMKLAGAAFGVILAVVLGSTAYAQQPTAAAAVDRFLALNASGQLQSAEGQRLRDGRGI